MKIGSLFSGYSGLDMAVSAVTGAETAWFVEFDAAPSKILAHHYPTIPNYGDITAVDWAAVQPVDILTGGFPCQDVSLAGRRAGMKDGTRSGLWTEFAKAIDALRPELVVIENVRGLLSAEAHSSVEPCPWCVGDGDGEPPLRALGAVLGDLSDLGYDAEWCGLRAADAGAPHGRFRVFVVAYPSGLRGPHVARIDGDESAMVGPESGAGDRDSPGRSAARVPRLGRGSGTVPATLANPEHVVGHGGGRAWHGRPELADRNWGAYDLAIRRWESFTGRHAPSATRADGRDRQPRLNAAFVEWMMGLPAGWVTDPTIGLTRSEQLKALGNGVVPQQAELALRTLLRVGVAA